MKKEILTEIEIQASPQEVWQALMDTPRYPEWNPFLIQIDGVLQQNATPFFHLRDEEGRKMKIRSHIHLFEPQKMLGWSGRVFLGSLRYQHHLQLKTLPNGHTQFIQHEEFHGWIIRFILKDLETIYVRCCENMNRALKIWVENHRVFKNHVRPSSS